ncbi:MAG: hypothetical protein M1144_04685, partial [Candidatus Thermoplasmatota archaeon]|nr:hypothetical protein [Candidatus Thermoplasmatota archaeon]
PPLGEWAERPGPKTWEWPQLALFLSPLLLHLRPRSECPLPPPASTPCSGSAPPKFASLPLRTCTSALLSVRFAQPTAAPADLQVAEPPPRGGVSVFRRHTLPLPGPLP